MWGTAAIGGTAVALGALETRRRSQDDRRLVGPFDVEVEWAYASGADKLGHIISTGAQAEGYATAYRLAGHSREAAATWGAATAFAWMLHYEVLDGLGRRVDPIVGIVGVVAGPFQRLGDARVQQSLYAGSVGGVVGAARHQ